MTQDQIPEASTLNEYTELGSYHTDLKLSHKWLPRYLRRLHIVRQVCKAYLPLSASILDVGGGEGVLTKQLIDDGFFNAQGIDPYAPPLHENMKKGSILEIPFDAHSFDAITCLDVLEHIPLQLQEKAANELYRILKPEGFALISVPNMAHLKSRINFLLKGSPWRNKLDKHPGELAIIERANVLKKAGFIIAEKIGIHLTLTYEPTPQGFGGNWLTQIMFNPNVPTDLCWTVMFFLSKTDDTNLITKFYQDKPLKTAFKNYIPDKIDPTYKALF